MAIAGITQSVAAVGAYDNQAQTGDAQNNSLATQQRKDVATQPRLSAFGRVKSTLADLQAQAQAIRNFSKPPTLEDFKTVVHGFVQSFNNLSKTVNQGFFQRQNALNGESSPNQAFSEIRKAMTGPDGTSLGTLQKVGVDRNHDGLLTINQNTLEKHFQDNSTGSLATFADMAARVGSAIDKQLSGSGSFGKKVQDLSSYIHDPGNTGSVSQDRLDAHKNYQQRLASQLANAGGYAARNAVVTYLNVASF